MIELLNINKTYQMGDVSVQALKNVSLKILPGEFVAIMGPSGSGKSTLLHVLGLLDRPDSGSYYLGGRSIESLSDDELSTLRNYLAGFIFQQFHLLPRMSAMENVELPLFYSGKKKGISEEKLKEVGLSDRMSHKPNELSGGQQQRVAIARSLVNDPLIIFADEPTGNLDTKSSEEIIAILKDLNRNGKTIVMVTHEQEIADHAQRVIHMRDGEIVSDKWNEVEETIKQRPDNDISLDTVFSESRAVRHKIKFVQHIQQAVYSVFSHKMRSFLSMLGILIGVGAVIAMLAVGEGAKESISQRLSSLGSNLLVVHPGSMRMHGVSLESGTVTRFSIKDAEEIENIPQVKSVSPSVNGRAQIVYGNKNWNTQVRGVGVSYASMHNAAPTFGEFFTESDVRTRNKVVVIGTTVARELFGNINPVGATVKINRINFKVIGVSPQKGSWGPRDQDDIVTIPITTAMYRVLGKDYIDEIEVEVKDVSLIEDARTSITDLIKQRHHLNGKEEDSFEIFNTTEIKEMLQSTTKTMTLLLGSIAAISLLVGGIGIMNILLVSVTERTREIGLRKAIGARKKDILIQFLVEAIVMTFIGGIAGILVGSGIAAILSAIAGWAIKVSASSIALATIFSVAVGIGFGLWPANKAAQMNPIEALRYE